MPMATLVPLVSYASVLATDLGFPLIHSQSFVITNHKTLRNIFLMINNTYEESDKEAPGA